MSVSVEDNYLVVRDKCREICRKKIFDLFVDGSIELSKSFLPLWTLYQPASNHHLFTVDSSYPNFVVFPRVNPVNFQGTLIPETEGFVNFLRNDGQPTKTSAVINEGLALQMYVNNQGEKPDYLIEWDASKSVKWVLLYFLINGGNTLVLSVDRSNRLSRYQGNTGKATFPQGGYMYMKCISASDDFSVKLRITAVQPPSHQSLIQFKPGKLCLNLKTCGFREKIHVATNINLSTNSYETIPATQWENVFNLVDKTISEITTIPIPLAPIIRTFQVDYKMLLISPIADMIGDGGPPGSNKDGLCFKPSYRKVDPSLVITRDEVDKFIPSVPEAIQDNSEALQPIFFDGTALGDVITAIPASLDFTVNFIIKGGTLNNYNSQFQFQNRIGGTYIPLTFYTSEINRANNINPMTTFKVEKNTSSTAGGTVYFKSLPDVRVYATLFVDFPFVDATVKMDIHYDIRS